MSHISSPTKDETPEPKIPRKTLIAAGIVIVIAAVAVTGYLYLTSQGPFAPSSSARFQEAATLYSKSVDLANDGDYQDALTDADQALALNVTSFIPLIQSDRAGILVELGRYQEAIDAANVAINSNGNTTMLKSIAYYNKANALRALGADAEADANYANATALNPSLKHP